jgi:hypothetical protein
MPVGMWGMTGLPANSCQGGWRRCGKARGLTRGGSIPAWICLSVALVVCRSKVDDPRYRLTTEQHRVASWFRSIRAISARPSWIS